jgi:hypothetical protein
MFGTTSVEQTPVSVDEDQYLPPDVPVSTATRYLCAAAHLRRSMLPEEITETGMAPRAPLPVGRVYALQVLFGPGRHVPMPGVQCGEVRRHCRRVLIQTSLRDVAAIAAITAAGLMAPWPTLITLAIILFVMMPSGRIRLSSPVLLILAAIAMIALIFRGSYSGGSITVPLVALVACFTIYLTDNLCARFVIRRLWKRRYRLVPPDTAPDRNKIYYVGNRILGAGVPLTPVTLTVAVDKAAAGKEHTRRFTASDLLRNIADHIQGQGISGDALYPSATFTHGLPNLDIDEVVATPLPRARKVPAVPIEIRGIDIRGRLDGGEIHSIANRSPSIHPDRHYVRASATTWDGQIVAAIYVSAALQGHYLRVIIRPYVLLPTVPDLVAANRIADWSLALQFGTAALDTVRQFRATVEALREPHRPPRRSPATGSSRSSWTSPRERYARLDIDNSTRSKTSNASSKSWKPRCQV